MAVTLLFGSALVATLTDHANGQASLYGPSEPMTIRGFDVQPTEIEVGGSARLSWGVSNSIRVSIEPDIGAAPPMAVIMVSPKSTTEYTLTAWDGLNPSQTAKVTLTVLPKKQDQATATHAATVEPPTTKQGPAADTPSVKTNSSLASLVTNPNADILLALGFGVFLSLSF
jgi:hypothetical protein